MAIIIWKDDYLTGFDLIDTQHIKIFHMINTFEEQNDKEVSVSVVAHFAENLISLCEEHFALENKIMENNDYPLADYHKKIHEDYLEKMKQLFLLYMANGIKDPYHYIIDIAANWMHHVVRDDLTLFYHCKHKDFVINEEITGKSCEIFTLDNRLIGYGNISSFSHKDIVINCTSEYISLIRNETVKISVSVSKLECRYFVARVHTLRGSTLKLLQTAVVKTINDREFYRISVNINAKLWDRNQKKSKMKILNISGGGLLIETDALLLVGDEIMVEFTLKEDLFL